MRILPNISRIKGNQAKKFSQLIQCNVRNFYFSKNHVKHETGRLVPDRFFQKS